MFKNGDVKLDPETQVPEDDKIIGTPMICWNGVWSPICGHYFWDNQHGATKFCQLMGYDTGYWEGKKSGSYNVDSFRIGKCEENDDWMSCSGGCNDYEVGGKCYWLSSCTAGQNIKFSIACTGADISTLASGPG